MLDCLMMETAVAKRELIHFNIFFKKGVTEKVATDAMKKYAPKLNFDTLDLGEGSKKCEVLGSAACTRERFEKLFGVKLTFTTTVRNARVRRPVAERIWKTDPPLKVPATLIGIASRIEISQTRAGCSLS